LSTESTSGVSSPATTVCGLPLITGFAFADLAAQQVALQFMFAHAA